MKRILAKAVAIKSKVAIDFFGVSGKLRAKVLKHSSNEHGWEDRRKKRRDAIDSAMTERKKNHRSLQ